MKNPYKEMPHYCKIVVEGRINALEPWSLRNALRDENAAILDPKSGMTKEKLLALASNFAEEWRRNYPNGGQTRVVQFD